MILELSPQLAKLVAIMNPLQQGLKHVFFWHYLLLYMVAIMNPLQQGLKPAVEDDHVKLSASLQ